jgi:hypothetical protein
MPLPTTTINFDADIPNGTEYEEGRAFVVFQLAKPDWDTEENIALTTEQMRYPLDANGQAVAQLWPPERGNVGNYYNVWIENSVTQFGRGLTVPVIYPIIRPPVSETPVNITTLFDLSAPPAPFRVVSFLTQAEYDAAIAAGEQAAASAASAAASAALADSEGNATIALNAATAAQASAALAADTVALLWSPSDLLDAGGAILAPLAPASGNVWTDTARTTPATAAGDLIASVRLTTDGADVFAEQATSGDRPRLGRRPIVGVRNLLSNSAAIGAVVGAPGTLPTTWTRSGGTIVSEVVATGSDPDGHPYVDIRITGSPGTGGVIQLSGNTDTPVVAGNLFAWSAKIARVGGDATNINSVSLQMGWRNSGGSFISQTTDALDFKGETSLTLRSMSATAVAGAFFVLPQIRLNCSGAVDITLRVSGAQFEAGAARTAWQRTTSPAGVLRLDVTETGVQDAWYLRRATSGVQMSVTLPNLGTAATVGRATQAGAAVLTGQTVSGAFNLFSTDPQDLFALVVAGRALSDAEAALLERSLTRAIEPAPVAPVTPVASGPVSLAALGYTPASGDVRDLVAAAAALSESDHVIIPFNVAPWIQGGQWVIPAGLTVEWEMGARVAQDHTAIDGVRLGAGVKLIRPYFTSTVYTRTNMIGLDLATAQIGYAHNRRAIRVEGDDVQILDVQMLEFMAGGIKDTAHKGLRVTGLKARHLRSAEGFAAAINIGGNWLSGPQTIARDAYIEVDTIEDCDRAMEPEDGATNITFVAKPGILRRIWSRFGDIAGNPTAQGFCISAHSHDYSPATVGAKYLGAWTCIDCVTPVFCDKPSGDASQMPRDFHVESVHIVNTAAFPTSLANRAQVWIEGNSCTIGAVTFEHPDGAPISVARTQIREGRGNSITLPGPDIQAALPWVTVSDGAIATRVDVTCTNISTQPSVPANAAQDHLIEDYGAGTSIVARVHGVQHRGYVQFRGVARGGRVRDFDFRLPATDAANAAVRFSGESCAVENGTFISSAGIGQLGRLINNATRNRITGVTAITSGTFATLDTGSPGAVGNLIANNSYGTATVSGAAGNTVVNNV